VEGAAGAVGAGAVFGAIGADGRAVDDPTVVPGALATLGPFHGAHINKSATTAIPTMSDGKSLSRNGEVFHLQNGLNFFRTTKGT